MPGPQGAGGAPAMNLGKLSPVGWVSSSQGKKRLTADMISPPLGDFRHTMHVGRGGDVFGDTSFLSNHGGGSGSTHRSPRGFLAKKLQLVRRVGAPPRRMASPPAPSPAPPAISPIIKNAISLPQLNQAAYDSLVVGKLSFDRSPASSTDGHSAYGLDSGFCTISRLPRPEKPRDRDRDSSFPAEPELLGAMSLSEGSAAETPAPAPAASPPASVANPPAPASSPSLRGRCPNGVTTRLGPVAEARASVVGEGPRAPADEGPGKHWGAVSGGSQSRRHYTEVDARAEGLGALSQARASWGSLDEEWGASQAGSRTPVPSTVQANTFEFADAEEDDEVKV
uniref:CDC42 effector protein 1 n=1 Tax=Bos indicus x Bos taurus TaxID=30522 RepID=A0A4W2GUC4_BOBOX